MPIEVWILAGQFICEAIVLAWYWSKGEGSHMTSRIRIQRPTVKRPAPREIDTRTPSGKPLPY